MSLASGGDLDVRLRWRPGLVPCDPRKTGFLRSGGDLMSWRAANLNVWRAGGDWRFFWLRADWMFLAGRRLDVRATHAGDLMSLFPGRLDLPGLRG